MIKSRQAKTGHHSPWMISLLRSRSTEIPWRNIKGALLRLKEKYKHILSVRKKATTTTSSLATPSGNTSGNWQPQPLLLRSDHGLQTGNMYMSGSQALHAGGWSSRPPLIPGSNLPPGLMAGIWPSYSPPGGAVPALFTNNWTPTSTSSSSVPAMTAAIVQGNSRSHIK